MSLSNKAKSLIQSHVSHLFLVRTTEDHFEVNDSSMGVRQEVEVDFKEPCVFSRQRLYKILLKCSFILDLYFYIVCCNIMEYILMY